MQTQQDRARAEWLAQRRGAELKELDFWIAKLPESRELRWVRVSRKCWGYTAIHLECVGPCVIQPKVWRPAQADAVARRLPVLAQDQGRAGPGWVTHEWCPLSSVFTHLWRILLHRSAYPEVGQTKIGHPSIHPRHIRETPTSVSLITLVLSKKENTSFRFARKSTWHLCWHQLSPWGSHQGAAVSGVCSGPGLAKRSAVERGRISSAPGEVVELCAKVEAKRVAGG